MRSASAASFNVVVGLTCEYASNTLASLANFAIDVINPFKSTLTQLKNDIQEVLHYAKCVNRLANSSFRPMEKGKDCNKKERRCTRVIKEYVNTLRFILSFH
jgi:hypothetical protein